MLALITLPDPTTILSASSPWFSTWFTEWWAWAIAGIGILMAFTFVRWLIHAFETGIRSLFHHDDSWMPKKYEETSEYEWRKKHGRTIYD